MKWFFALFAAGCGVILWMHFNPKAVPPVAQATLSPSPTGSPSPLILHPIPIEPSQSPAPNSQEAKPIPKTVGESDSTIQDALNTVFGKEKFEALFNLTDIVRRFVVSIDNLTKPQQPSQEFSPLKPLTTEFKTTGKNGNQSISPENYARYSSYVDLLQNVDMEKLVKIYIHFYSLFQTAYQDLGTQGYFNDRLVEVIDNLLATPEVRDPIKVAQPTYKYRYKYVDDQLEALSSGQKILIRMGNDNAQIIKAKLKQLRALLVAQKQF